MKRPGGRPSNSTLHIRPGLLQGLQTHFLAQGGVPMFMAKCTVGKWVWDRGCLRWPVPRFGCVFVSLTAWRGPSGILVDPGWWVSLRPECAQTAKPCVCLTHLELRNWSLYCPTPRTLRAHKTRTHGATPRVPTRVWLPTHIPTQAPHQEGQPPKDRGSPGGVQRQFSDPSVQEDPGLCPQPAPNLQQPTLRGPQDPITLAGPGPLSLGTNLGPAEKTAWNPWGGQVLARPRRVRPRGEGH